MGLRFETISFLSDYGHDDEFVGVVRSVIRSIAPGVTVVDIAHQIEPFNVRAGGLALARAASYLVPGVVLAVVDPGVGTERRPVAIEVGGGQSYLVGPDNGLLAPAVAMVGGATGAVVLDNTELHLASPGATFDGRDVFAPAAAHLCLGIEPAELGTPIDPGQLLPGLLPVSQLDDDGSITAEVLRVDRFGNVQLNVDPDQLDGWPPVLRVATGDGNRIVTRAASFAEIGPGATGLVVDSQGLLALAVNQGSAADDLRLGESDQVVLTPAEREPATRSAAVQLTDRRGGSQGGIR
jgi:S-adenosylmethionine hydrolase